MGNKHPEPKTNFWISDDNNIIFHKSGYDKRKFINNGKIVGRSSAHSKVKYCGRVNKDEESYEFYDD